MKKIQLFFYIFFLNNLYCSSLEKMDYWLTQRKGANFFNEVPADEWFVEAKKAGIQFVRLAVDKWESEGKDFLIGDADEFIEINMLDFKVLESVLDSALSNNIRVVISLLSLPGSRWKQNNQNINDCRIWREEKYRQQAIAFWKKLAKLLRDHPALVGYNILNEPHPEVFFGHDDFSHLNFQKWYALIKGTLADLNLFYKDIVDTIRQVDIFTPIILDTGMYANPWAINYLLPIKDDKILYSFHMYEPYPYTTRRINNKQFSYPGKIPLKMENDLEDESRSQLFFLDWNLQTLYQFFQPVLAWQEKYEISSSQILVGEFGCDRTSKGAFIYLADLIKIFNSHGWHWAFYAFREDCWDSMDYELGMGHLDERYWEAIEKKTSLNPFRFNNPLFDIIKDALQK